MKENLGLDSSEQDSSDDDEDTEKKKKTTKIARRLALGLKVGTENKGTALDKPRLSIGERLLQQMEAKAAKAVEETDEPVEHEDDEPEGAVGSNDKSNGSDHTRVSEQSVEGTVQVSSLSNEEKVITPPLAVTTNDVEAANWDSEGDITDSGEINLNRPEHSVDEDTPEPTEEFVEVPIDTSLEEEPSAPVDPDVLATGLGDSEPPEPPEVRRKSIEPADSGVYSLSGGAAERPWYDAAATDRLRREHESDVNDAEYRGEKRGIRHGVATGLFAGWLFGRRGKNKAEKAHVKALKTKNEEIKDLKSEQLAAKERINAIQRTQEQLRSNIQNETAKATTKAEEQPRTSHELPHNTTSSVEVNRETVPVEIATSLTAAVKKPANHGQDKNVEKTHEEQEITEETYMTQDGSRIETSAWHRIEIDEKTGKPVENPDIAYGEEFRRERRQEILPEDRTGGVTNGSASMLGGLATASLAEVSSPSASTLDQTSNLNDLQHAQLSSSEVHQHLTAGNELLRYASKPLTWAVAIIIVVVLFVVGILR